jgi:drug/metabolite transporter (DMT)-like permease
MVLLGKLQQTTPCDHAMMVLQGGCLFSFNFLCFYTATESIASGLLSVVFSLATVFNALNGKLIWGDTIPRRVIIAGSVGFCGLVLLFWPEFAGQTVDPAILRGIALAVLGTYFFSLGNMISRRHGNHGLHPLTTNSYAMCYGAIILAFSLWLSGESLSLPTAPSYYWALIYLSIFGSIVAFTSYLMLVNRLGANKAAYSTVIFPLIALLLSSLFEGYQWHWTAIAGLGLALVGNIIIVTNKNSCNHLFALFRRLGY